MSFSCLLLKLFDDMDALTLSSFLWVPREEAEDQLCTMGIEHDCSVVALVVARLVLTRENYRNSTFGSSVNMIVESCYGFLCVRFT